MSRHCLPVLPPTCPAVAPQLWSAARTSSPWPTCTLPAHLPSCKDGGLSTPSHQTEGTRGGARLLCSPFTPLPAHTLRHITLTLTHTHTGIHPFIIEVFIEHLLHSVFGACSRHWGFQQRAKQTFMELTLSGESSYLSLKHTQTHTSPNQSAPGFWAGPLPLPINEQPLG